MFHSFCPDKKDLMYAELEACKKVLKYAGDAHKKIVESEIRELKMVLDLLTQRHTGTF
ncbi:MAG TPA: hypothetical protein VEH06_09515 [Candidatus Bathyarchaeia archaeon]|nr:hypothetical protein [Candidatus Bathyarchaeia archaeon]